jgi:sporulation protein YlmC with PRC-barrel domain
MMRTLLSTTALVALFSMGAVAQEANTAGPSNLLTEGYQVVDTDGLASKLIGFPVYSSAANDAERIGEINDIVIGDDGNVNAVIIGVGGFLGVGEKNVAVDYSELQWATAEDNTERAVLETSKEALEAAVAVEMIDDEPNTDVAAAPAADQPADNDAMEADPDADVAVAPAAPAADQPADATETGAVQPDTMTPADPNATTMDPLNREKLVDLDETTLTAEELTGTHVYGPSDEHIGTIGDFVLGEGEGSIDAVIIDFGGFLGIGTKEVAVAYEDLQFFADENGDNRSLVLNVTREQMEAAPAFNRDTYAAERDAQRIVVSPAVASAG